MENVSGIFSRKNEINEDFEKSGYLGTVIKLSASDFGIPQRRNRVFFIMFRKDFFKDKINTVVQSLHSSLNNIKDKSEKFVLKDALFGLKALKAKNIKNRTDIESDDFGYYKYKNQLPSNNYISLINNYNEPSPFIFNHKSRYNNERDIQIFGLLPQGGDSTNSSIKKINPYKSREGIFKDKYYKLVSNNISKTITAHMKFDCNMYIHPTQARGLTPREAARIQSYPDLYEFKGPYTKWYMQVGNSVPPLLSYYLAISLEKILNEFS